MPFLSARFAIHAGRETFFRTHRLGLTAHQAEFYDIAIKALEEKISNEKYEGMDMRAIGTRMLMAMGDTGITQRELAKTCGTTEVSISRYVNGSRIPKGDMIVKIAKALYVSTDWLLGVEEHG